MAKRHGRLNLLKVAGSQYDVVSWNVDETAIEEDATDTGSAVVGDSIVDTQEVVAVGLAGSCEILAKDDVTLGPTGAILIVRNATIALKLYEGSTLYWDITEARVTGVTVASKAKGLTRKTIKFRASNWVEPAT